MDGGSADPLVVYERVFADLEEEPTAWRRAEGKVALRFPDPMGRQDSAGRVISHEFVVFGDLANDIQSAEEGRQRVWPLVAEAYARVWDAESPPSVVELRFDARTDESADGPPSLSGDGGDD